MGMIYLKTDDEIELLRRANLLVGKTLAELAKIIKPGVTTRELDKVAEEFIRDNGAEPTFKGFPNPYGSPFPASICASVNEQVVHGIPNDIPLKDGDIVSIDCGTLLDGFNGDSCYTFAVGEISDDVKKLLNVTKESLYLAIEQAVAGHRIGDISYAVQQHCEAHGYGVVREFVGHGIGREMHEEPEVPNFYTKRKGIKLQKGMTLAVEPMINAGTWEVAWTEDDDWTVYTRDGSLSAHYENTIAITDGEPEVLSLLPEEKKLYNVK